MAEINLNQIRAMEEEFLKLQKIEIAIDSGKGKIAAIISKFASSIKTYTSAKKLDNLIDEAESIISDIAKTGQVRGKVMSLKTMNEYLEKSEKTARTQRLLDIISRQNSKRAQARLELYVDELAKEKNILYDEIKLFRKRGRIAGFSEKEINKQLVGAAANNASPIDSFGRRLKTLEKAVLRREASATEIDEYQKAVRPGEKWQWITVSGNPCPDCRIRAGVVMSFGEWQERGLPGDGRTICRASCMCKLMPAGIADDLFPEVKTYTWNRESGVLTTASEMRSFGAKKNRPE